MKTLAPDLFQRRFEDLMEIGRAQLPALAPAWTDHNVHDPGITLMELLAWVAEAQLYSLSRNRRDERLAFAALLGARPGGARSARGTLWPDPDDPDSPASTLRRVVVVSADAVVHARNAPMPTFQPAEEILWVPGRVERLEYVDASGGAVDLTAANRNGRIPFQPFGERAGSRDVLRMRYECADRFGLLGEDRERVRGARWPIGLMSAFPGRETPEEPEPDWSERSPFSARIVLDDGDRFELGIVSDSTRGATATGVILLDLDRLDVSPKAFTLEIRPRKALPRPPRVFRIEPNVLPIVQGRRAQAEVHQADGQPDWSFTIAERGLRYGAGEEPLVIQTPEPSGLATWRRRDRLAESGPGDLVYRFNPATGEVVFGNGINGRIPPRGAQVLVSYATSEGADGVVARNRSWVVAGFPGIFGVNPDPITGGADASTDLDNRREARRRIRQDHPLVSAFDIVEAATTLASLDVARAWVATPPPNAPPMGLVTLIAMRGRPAGEEPTDAPPESPAWLEALRRRLAPRMLLGTRLVVVAPRYVDFTIQAVVEAQPAVAPSDVQARVEKTLADHLILVPGGSGEPPRRAGVPVALADVAAWIRSTPGTRRVLELSLKRTDGGIVDQIKPSRNGLPRWLPAPGTIQVQRPETGGSR